MEAELKTEARPDSDVEFNWGSLGDAWWHEAAGEVGADDRQTKFACALFNGATAAGAARLSGYSEGTPNQAGYKAKRTTVVQNLLAIANAEAKGSSDGLVDEGEIRRTLTRLIRSPDPTVKLRAIEAHNKMKDQAAEAGRSILDDGFAEWRIARDFLQMPNGGCMFVLHHAGNGAELAALPLLHDVHASVMRDDPDLWARLRKKNTATSVAVLDWRLSDQNYQLDARTKLWKEIGIDILDDDRKRFAGVAPLPNPLVEPAQKEISHAQ